MLDRQDGHRKTAGIQVGFEPEDDAKMDSRLDEHQQGTVVGFVWLLPLLFWLRIYCLVRNYTSSLHPPIRPPYSSTSSPILSSTASARIIIDYCCVGMDWKWNCACVCCAVLFRRSKSFCVFFRDQNGCQGVLRDVTDMSDAGNRIHPSPTPRMLVTSSPPRHSG